MWRSNPVYLLRKKKSQQECSILEAYEEGDCKFWLLVSCQTIPNVLTKNNRYFCVLIMCSKGQSIRVSQLKSSGISSLFPRQLLRGGGCGRVGTCGWIPPKAENWKRWLSGRKTAVYIHISIFSLFYASYDLFLRPETPFLTSCACRLCQMRSHVKTWLQGPPGRLWPIGGRNHGRVGKGRGLSWVRSSKSNGRTITRADHAFLREEAIQGVAERGEDSRVKGPVAELRLPHALQKICEKNTRWYPLYISITFYKQVIDPKQLF